MKKRVPKKKGVTFKTRTPSLKISEGTSASSESLSKEDISLSKKLISNRVDELRNCEPGKQIMKTSTSTNGGGTSDLPMKRKLAVEGVFFRCPTIGPGIYKKEEWTELMRVYLKQLAVKDEIQSACLKIKSLNPLYKVEECVNVLEKYVINLMQFPKEEKYQYIKLTNKNFQEKVECAEGAMDFLTAVGFNKKNQNRNGEETEFLVYSKKKNVDLGNSLFHLQTTKPIQLILDRGSRVYLPSEQIHRSDILPDDFFQITISEIRREQNKKAADIENERMLKTKTMRDKELSSKPKKIPAYSLIRIRYPDGSILQGTFSTSEKLSDVKEFARSHLNTSTANFELMAAPGMVLGAKDDSKTLLELNLVPAVMLTFMWKLGKPVPKLRQGR